MEKYILHIYKYIYIVKVYMHFYKKNKNFSSFHSVGEKRLQDQGNL